MALPADLCYHIGNYLPLDTFYRIFALLPQEFWRQRFRTRFGISLEQLEIFRTAHVYHDAELYLKSAAIFGDSSVTNLLYLPRSLALLNAICGNYAPTLYYTLSMLEADSHWDNGYAFLAALLMNNETVLAYLLAHPKGMTITRAEDFMSLLTRTKVQLTDRICAMIEHAQLVPLNNDTMVSFLLGYCTGRRISQQRPVEIVVDATMLLWEGKTVRAYRELQAAAQQRTHQMQRLLSTVS